MIDNECLHHWLLEPPNGPVTEGVCKKCDLTKEFDNSENINKRARRNPVTGTVFYTPDIVLNHNWHAGERLLPK
jgi:hypothetical protein